MDPAVFAVGGVGAAFPGTAFGGDGRGIENALDDGEIRGLTPGEHAAGRRGDVGGVEGGTGGALRAGAAGHGDGAGRRVTVQVGECLENGGEGVDGHSDGLILATPHSTVNPHNAFGPANTPGGGNARDNRPIPRIAIRPNS